MTERASIDEEQFWTAVEELHGSSDEAAVHRLRETLISWSPAQIEAFNLVLQKKLNLMSHALISELGTSVSGIEDVATDDDALFLACAVLAKGRKFYDEVLAGVVRASESLDPSAGDLLAAVASQAYEATTGSVLVVDVEVPGANNNTVRLRIITGGSNFRMARLWDALFSRAERRLAGLPPFKEWAQAAGVTQVRVFVQYKEGGQEELVAGEKNGVIEARVTRDRKSLPMLPSMTAVSRESANLVCMIAARLGRPVDL